MLLSTLFYIRGDGKWNLLVCVVYYWSFLNINILGLLTQSFDATSRGFKCVLLAKLFSGSLKFGVVIGLPSILGGENTLF